MIYGMEGTLSEDPLFTFVNFPATKRLFIFEVFILPRPLGWGCKTEYLKQKLEWISLSLSSTGVLGIFKVGI
jgi:hypothetical protein